MPLSSDIPPPGTPEHAAWVEQLPEPVAMPLGELSAKGCYLLGLELVGAVAKFARLRRKPPAPGGDRVRRLRRVVRAQHRPARPSTGEVPYVPADPSPAPARGRGEGGTSPRETGRRNRRCGRRSGAGDPFEGIAF